MRPPGGTNRKKTQLVRTCTALNQLKRTNGAFRLVLAMEKKQKEAERSRRNRRKRKNEFEIYKEFYEYATENNMPLVQEYEVKRQRRQQQEQPVIEPVLEEQSIEQEQPVIEPVLEEQSIEQEQPVLEEQQPETGNGWVVVDDIDDILDVDFSGFEW